MAAQLGIGVRVYVGWTPKDRTEGDEDCRCRTGVIVDGPFPAGPMGQRFVEFFRAERESAFGGPWWLVDCGDPHPSGVVERLLTPIDGGDGSEVEREQELEHA